MRSYCILTVMLLTSAVGAQASPCAATPILAPGALTVLTQSAGGVVSSCVAAPAGEAWFEFCAGASGSVSLTTSGSMVTVYTGGSCLGLQEETCGFIGATVSCVPGGKYYVRVSKSGMGLTDVLQVFETTGSVIVAPSTEQFEMNDPCCHHDWNGVQNDGTTAAQIVVASLQPITVSIWGTGLAWEGALSAVPAVPRNQQIPFYATCTQVVNLQIQEELFFWNGALSGTSSIGALAPYNGPLSYVFPAPALASFGTWQMLMVDATHPDGYCLSQASEMVVVQP